MITKYKTNCAYDEIKVVEVVKETAKFVHIPWGTPRGGQTTRREAKRSNYENYFDTWEEAHDFIMGKVRHRISAQEASLRSLRKTMTKIKAMEKTDLTSKK